ncbi:MAG: fructose-2,6-bisphosphatase, partial [Granulosicoccus sp.]|nr:fructose-2,6-bisphosphatase [Granulosicoccus sp.]
RTRQLREWLANETSNLPLLLVTHQVNISALTGQFASSGEIIVVELTKENEIIVKGSFAPR